MYNSGDLARYLADGSIDYLGRADHQVKIRGFRMELGEIEAALKKTFGVRDAVAMVREDSPGDKRLVAYVVAAQDQERLMVSDLRGALLRSLPDYMIPSLFVFLEQLPLNPNGKLDRKALPMPEAGGNDTRYVAPLTENEQMLASIWESVLKLERVGTQDNFFEIGGHSLLAVQIITCIRQQMGVDVSIEKLFSNPTIALLDEVIIEAELGQFDDSELERLLAEAGDACEPIDFSDMAQS